VSIPLKPALTPSLPVNPLVSVAVRATLRDVLYGLRSSVSPPDSPAIVEEEVTPLRNRNVSLPAPPLRGMPGLTAMSNRSAPEPPLRLSAGEKVRLLAGALSLYARVVGLVQVLLASSPVRLPVAAEPFRASMPAKVPPRLRGSIPV